MINLLKRLGCARGYLALLAFLLIGFWFIPSNGEAPRIFARVHGDEVKGYASFAGGVRVADAPWEALMGVRSITRGRTDRNGTYTFIVPQEVTEDIVIRVDVQEGRVVKQTLPAEHFGRTTTRLFSGRESE